MVIFEEMPYFTIAHVAHQFRWLPSVESYLAAADVWANSLFEFYASSVEALNNTRLGIGCEKAAH